VTFGTVGKISGTAPTDCVVLKLYRNKKSYAYKTHTNTFTSVIVYNYNANIHAQFYFYYFAYYNFQIKNVKQTK